ncbi:hypothetical protein AG1IA_06300 [Rhizoctonia solani AG-1 IA]|uniref:Uncharacterized protein n=1 Tax=Thanatephorus cucumeris (strain AG1-IA) TaxID=983506 RepID=L8WNW3_THACA|nr:hypothetical protein AG1IA_06300 [Rhizoctonia solani AG-1 IA]
MYVSPAPYLVKPRPTFETTWRLRHTLEPTQTNPGLGPNSSHPRARLDDECTANRTMLDLFEYPKQANDQIPAIQTQSEKDQTDQRELAIAQLLDLPIPNAISQVKYFAHGLALTRLGSVSSFPENGFSDGGSSFHHLVAEIGVHNNDKEHFREGVDEFGGRGPDSEWATKVFELQVRRKDSCDKIDMSTPFNPK